MNNTLPMEAPIVDWRETVTLPTLTSIGLVWRDDIGDNINEDELIV